MNQTNTPLIIISAPSGVGKTTIVHGALLAMPTLHKVITCTTRDPRPEEKDGKDYYFLSKEEFEKGIKGNLFLEWAHIYEDSYGTRKQDVNTIIERGLTPLLILDTQGAQSVRDSGMPCVTIFIQPESIEQIHHHLERDIQEHKRNADMNDISERLALAQKELSKAPQYDYRITNKEGDIEGSIAQLKALLDKIIEKSYK